MKPSEIMLDLGRPVAYYPSLAIKVGGVKAGIFLCQLLYWTGKQKDKDGWIYKTQEDWESETGLSVKEQRTARRQLKCENIIEERWERAEFKVYYRIEWENFNALFPTLPCAQTAYTIRPSSDSLKGTTEITTENTNTTVSEKTPETPILESTELPPTVVRIYDPDEPDSIITFKTGKRKLSHECPDNWPVMKALRTASHSGPGEDDARIGREAKLIRKCEPNMTPDQISQLIIKNFVIKSGYWFSAPHNFGKRVTYYPMVTQIRQHWTKAKEWASGKRINPEPSTARVTA